MKEVNLIQSRIKGELKTVFKTYCKSINKSMSEVLRKIIKKELKENSLMELEDPLTEFMEKYIKRNKNGGIQRVEFRKRYNDFRWKKDIREITATKLNRQINEFSYIVTNQKRLDGKRYYKGIEWKNG